jgi:hypothetical protein
MPDQEQTGKEVAATGRGALRVSHQDRDQVAESLRVAAGDGRLTAEELDERLERALTARTYDDLAVLVADLPDAGTAGGAVAPAPAKDLIKIHTTSGHSARVGRWTVPARMELRATSGHIKVDFTEAVITQPTLSIDASVRSGHITLITKPGIAVDMDDVSVRSGRVKVRAPWGDSVPTVLSITITGTCGSGRIIARPRRRSFVQWLRRGPMPYALTA